MSIEEVHALLQVQQFLHVHAAFVGLSCRCRCRCLSVGGDICSGKMSSSEDEIGVGLRRAQTKKRARGISPFCSQLKLVVALRIETFALLVLRVFG